MTPAVAASDTVPRYVILSPTDERIELFPGYTVVTEPGEHLFIRFGELYGTPGSRFSHPAVIRRAARVLDFKAHYRSGAKRWYSKPGVEFLLAFRKQDVGLKREEGYSYPKVSIGGVEFCLNVSGGTFYGGWADFIGTFVSASVGLGVRKLKRLAQCAVLPEDLPRDLYVSEAGLNSHERTRFIELCARADGVKSIDKGCRVALAKGWRMKGVDPGSLIVLQREGKARMFLVADKNGERVRLPYNGVDWVRTLELNGLPTVDPDDI